MVYRSYHWFIGFIVVTLILSPLIYDFIVLREVPTLFIVFLLAPYAVMTLILTGLMVRQHNVDHYQSAVQDNLDETGKYLGRVVTFRIFRFLIGEAKDFFVVLSICLLIISIRRQNFQLLLSMFYREQKRVPLRLRFFYFFTKGVIVSDTKVESLLNIFWKINKEVVKKSLDKLSVVADTIEHSQPIMTILK